MNWNRIIIRALVTAAQVALSVIIAGGALDVSADALQVAAMSGAGAGLSVLYNSLTQWLESSSPDH